MRAVVMILSLALLAGGAGVAVTAQEAERGWHDRRTACFADAREEHRRTNALLRMDMPFDPPGRCSQIERAWEAPRLILAAILGVGGVLALALLAVVRPAQAAPVTPQPMRPEAAPASRMPAPEPVTAQGALGDRAREVQRQAALRGLTISAEAAQRIAAQQIGRERSVAH
jgi:uncharacterized protein YceK